MDNREADAVPDQLQRRIQGFLSDASSDRAVSDAGGGVFLGTSIGQVRKKNEDRALVVRASYGREPERDFLLAALSDGMGGLANGEEAAIVALSTFAAKAIRSARIPHEQSLGAAALAANEAVYQLYRGRGGATLSAVLIDRYGGALGVNVGDSRIYLLGGSFPIEQLSRDDTLGEHVKDRGIFNEENRNGSLIQFVGLGEGMEPHLIDIPPRIKNKSLFVLTSDGIHGNRDFLNTATREIRSSSDLVNRLLLLADLLGGYDNATAIVVPDRAEFDSARSSEFALTLEFNSPFKETEIWITEIGDRAERNHFFHGRPRTPSTAERLNPSLSSSPELIEPEPQSIGSDVNLPNNTQSSAGSRRSRKSRKPPREKNPPKKDDIERQQAKIEFPKAE